MWYYFARKKEEGFASHLVGMGRRVNIRKSRRRGRGFLKVKANRVFAFFFMERGEEKEGHHQQNKQQGPEAERESHQ